MRGVYIHIPFCKEICSYCDFCKLYKNDDLIEKYLEALEKEVEKYYMNDKVKTIYVGGGTPSCLNKKELEKLFTIIDKFKISKNAEITFECNISDITLPLLKLISKKGVNRLSIGIESFNKKFLDIMHRSYMDVNKKMKMVKKYFKNVNADLIYGLNNETIDDLEEELDKILKLNLKHISIYSLILEKNTLLSINNYKEIDNDMSRTMYDIITKKLKENGYIHYEISNFAKPNYYSRHNMIYWNNMEYYGFGLGASGFVNNKRYTITRSLNNYLNDFKRVEEYEVTEKENMENEMILGLRKTKGVSKSRFYHKYGKKIEDVFNVKNLSFNKNNYYIPEKYLYVSNSILEDFVDI